MSAEATQARWRELRDRLDAAARERKDSQAAVVELSLRYGQLGAEERPAVDELLREWTLSADGTLQFDALAMIWDHSITSALPELQELLNRVNASDAPGTPFQRDKILRIMGRLQARAQATRR